MNTVCGGAGRGSRVTVPPSQRLKDQTAMKKCDSSRSGKGGGKAARKRRSTPAQRCSHRNLGESSRGWNALTEEQRIAWRRLALLFRSRTRKGRSYALDGQKLFNRINSVLRLLDREPRTDPPSLPTFGTNPEVMLQITGAGDDIALKLNVSETPTEEIMVFASPPYNAGRTYCGDFRFLGLLPASIECVSEITRIYLKKFGVPRDNSRVFIRTWQQVNGWENRAQMQMTSALVETRGVVAGGQQGGRVTPKKA